jgi:LacI family transcriptional regulator
MKRRVKMSDIAEELKISTVTVSKALSGKEGVSQDLRKLIKEKANEIGYIYNNLPFNLLKGRNYNIGILISSKYLGETSFYWIFYLKLLSVLRQTQYFGILEVVSEDDELNCTVPTFIAANKVDGIILLGQLSNEYLTRLTSKTIPCVFLDFYSEIGKCDSVALNNFLGSYNLVKLLIASGHTKIGFIGSTSATISILDRYMGYCKAMMEAGLSCDPAIEDRDTQGKYMKVELNVDMYTACVCNNDHLAGFIIRDLVSRGFKVPDDISIVGFDNEPETVTEGIGVTSLEVDIKSMCESAINLLISHMENKDYTPKGCSFIEGKIIIKDSIAEPKEVKKPIR